MNEEFVFNEYRGKLEEFAVLNHSIKEKSKDINFRGSTLKKETCHFGEDCKENLLM
jgi:hypothetical protein